MPDKWQEASFDKLRTQGAFLVSAVRQNGQTQWVKIRSLAGEPCIVKVPGWQMAFQAGKGRKINITALPDYEFVLDLKANEEVVIFPDENIRSAVAGPIIHSTETQNMYGLRRGKHLDRDQSWQLPEYIPEMKY